MSTIEINFGISEWSRHHPGAPWEERIKRIPLCEKLPNIEYRAPDKEAKPRKSFVANYQNVRKNQYRLLPAVIIDIMPRPPASIFDTALDLCLIWIEERNEWVAFEHRAWEESFRQDDESENGPYALDSYCTGKLLEAYHIPTGALAAQEAIRMSPKDLEKQTRT